MFFFLAVRNITRNFKDRILIALLIAVITFVFFAGNSIIENSNKNIRRIYVESITGDVVIEKTADVTMNLFGANVPIIDEFFAIPVLPAYNLAMEIIANESGIEGITSQVSGKAILDLCGVREAALLAGVDADSYFDLFPGIVLEQGRFLKANEYGAMITLNRAKEIERESGVFPQIGSMLMLTGGSSLGFKIREVPLTGIYSYENPGQFMNEIVIVDPQTVRILNSIQVAGAVQTNGTSTQLLSFNIDDIIGESLTGTEETFETEFTVDDWLHDFLSNSETEADIPQTGGDWNFIILRLKKGIFASGFISDLNKKLEPYGLTAVNWRIASGNSAILVLLITALFNAGIFLVSVGGIIAIINILLISIFRRVREIGTLRAIGASDSYIRSLLSTENIIVSGVAGIAGVLAGFLFTLIINSLGIHINNDLLAVILNGSILHVDFPVNIAFYSFLVAMLLGLIVTIYPMEAAVRIKPVVAVQRG